MNLLFNYLHYDKVYLYAKELREDKYEFIEEFFNKLEEEIKKETGGIQKMKV